MQEEAKNHQGMTARDGSTPMHTSHYYETLVHYFHILIYWKAFCSYWSELRVVGPIQVYRNSSFNPKIIPHIAQQYWLTFQILYSSTRFAESRDIFFSTRVTIAVNTHTQNMPKALSNKHLKRQQKSEHHIFLFCCRLFSSLISSNRYFWKRV